MRRRQPSTEDVPNDTLVVNDERNTTLAKTHETLAALEGLARVALVVAQDGVLRYGEI